MRTGPKNNKRSWTTEVTSPPQTPSTTPLSATRRRARQRICKHAQTTGNPPPQPAVKRRGLRSGPAPHAFVRREGGRGRASALPVPALEHKQEWGRDEAAVGPRAARGGSRGKEPNRAQVLSVERSRGPPELRRARSREGGPSPSRARSHEPGEPERGGRRRPAAVRQLQPG